MTTEDTKQAEALKELAEAEVYAIADAVVSAMPNGISGFLKEWGWRQFAQHLFRTLHGYKPADTRAEPPEGFVLVPKEPTQEMCQQGQWKAQEWPKFPLRISPIYKAMLAAAPQAKQEPKVELPAPSDFETWFVRKRGMVLGEAWQKKSNRESIAELVDCWSAAQARQRHETERGFKT